MVGPPRVGSEDARERMAEKRSYIAGNAAIAIPPPPDPPKNQR